MSEFVPESPPFVQERDAETLAEFLNRQLLALQDSISHRHNWDDTQRFDGSPQNGMLRYSSGGAAPFNKGPGFYYYDSGAWNYLVGEVLTYGAYIPGVSNVWSNVNSHDFTGHEYAGVDGCATTALAIKSNSVVTFGHNGVAYQYVGQRNVCLGVGGTYTTVADDYVPIGTNDHTILDNLDSPNQHPTSAIIGLDAEQAQQDANLNAHEGFTTAADNVHGSKTYTDAHANLTTDPDDAHGAKTYIDSEIYDVYGWVIRNFARAMYVAVGARNLPGASIDSGWTVIEFDTVRIGTNNMGVDPSNNLIRIENAAGYMITASLSFKHDERNQGRTTYLRIWDVDAAEQIGELIPVPIARNQPGTIFTYHANVDWPESKEDDGIQLQIGGGDDVVVEIWSAFDWSVYRQTRDFV